MSFMRKYTILNPIQIAEARRMAQNGVSQSELCKIFEVSAPTIHRHLFSDGPLMRRCEFCNDPFPIKGRSKYCDTDCRGKAIAKAQTKYEWRAVARREAVAALIGNHPEEFESILEIFMEKNDPKNAVHPAN